MNKEIKSFIEKNKIKLIKEKPIAKEKIDTKYYIENLSRIHKAFINEENLIRFKFTNDIWKLVQNFKLWNNRVSRLDCRDDVFTLINNTAKEAINSIENINYLELIQRAMRNNEVCVKKLYFNLKENIYKVEILESEKIVFGMVEDDYYEYFKKFKAENTVDLNKLVSFALVREGLGENSYIYINSLLRYPNNSMKYLQNTYMKGREIDVEKVSELAKKDFLI